MKPRVLLTGCTGEVGSRLTALLVSSGYYVVGIRGKRECSIRNPLHSCTQIDLLHSNISAFISNIKPDILIHTSWITSPPEFWDSSINYEWLNSSKKIIDAFEGTGGKYLVVTGTCAEYSWMLDESLAEDSPELPSTTYGKSKLELLKWIRSGTLPFLWTRTFFQFGSNEPSGRLIPSLIDSLLKGKVIKIRNANDTRDFVYIDDIVGVLHSLICQKREGVVNIGSGTGTKVTEIVRILTQLLGQEHLVHFESLPTQTSTIVSNPKKLNSLIGSYPWTSLSASLAESIEARVLNQQQLS